MKYPLIISDTLHSNLPPGDTAIALGFFDGIHLGHKTVIETAVAHQAQGLTPCVFTFTIQNSAPSAKLGQGLIQTALVKEHLLEKMGVEYLLCPDFEQIRQLTPSQFVKELLVDRYHAKKITCGENFRFGKGAAASAKELQQLCAPLGVEVEILPIMLYKGEPISSTRIRQALLEGRIEEVNQLLGYPYTMVGEVVHGARLGRTFGCPTINQQFAPEQVIPRNGVYASITYVDGKPYVGATNVGRKPTVDGKEVLAETYILDFDQQMYGQVLAVEFYHYLREEKKFSSLEELGEAVRANAQQARELLVAEGKFSDLIGSC